MARSVAALSFGNDYHYRFFWLQACRLFDERSKVTAVEIEAENIKSLDDVVVHYDGMHEYGKPLSADYYQVKFHVTAAGAFTFEGMMDPAFIGASSVSPLKRIYNAQLTYAPNGEGCRFYLYSPWSPHPDDIISELVSKTDGRIRWEVLSEGGDRSETGKVRTTWRDHLGLTSDEDLRKVLAPLRLQTGKTLDELGDTLNDKLRLAGLQQVPLGSMIHPYEALAKGFIQGGSKRFTRDDIERVCKSEGLWVGKTPFEPNARRIGIRSFLRFAENLEDETDEMLCLLKHFEGRAIKSQKLWDENVVPEVINFLKNSVKPGEHHLLHLPAHTSIAFLAGWYVGTKSGADIGLLQSGISGREVWKPNLSGNSEQDWQCRSIPINVGGNDVALAISVTHDVENDSVHFVKRNLPAVGRIISCRLPVISNASIRDSKHATSLANGISRILKEERTDSDRSGGLHIFSAAPNAFSFFFGQLSGGFGPVTLYEYDFESNLVGAYSTSITLPPPQVST